MIPSRLALGALAAAGALLASASLCAAAPLKVDAATQRRLGVATAPLAAAHRNTSVAGFAKVLDPGPLAALEADIVTAAAAADASRTEAARAHALNAADATVSKRAVETADAQARADAAKLALLQRRVGLEWGRAVSGLSAARRARLVADLSAGRAALVRIDTVAGQGEPGLRTASLDLGAAGKAQAVVLGPARTGDPRLQSAGVIALVSGPQAQWLPPGLTASVSAAAGVGDGGVVIPRAALLRVKGQTFAYVRTGPDGFERRRVDGGAPQPEGLFTPSGFHSGEAVVVAGGAALLAAETPAKPEGG